MALKAVVPCCPMQHCAVLCHTLPYLEGAGSVLGARGWQRALGQCVVAGVGVVVRMVAWGYIWRDSSQCGARGYQGWGHISTTPG